MRWLISFVLLALVAVALGLWLTRPGTDEPDVLASLTPDETHGARVFIAAGCASCHMAEGASGGDKLMLTGGQSFPSPFGTFKAPNISTSTQAGIGDWAAIDLWNALHHGTSPEGSHYYPALPYGAYIHMTPQDVVDLHAYMMTLPADETPSQPHDLAFPFSIRASVGAWKALYLRDDWVMTGDLDDQLLRGREIVEGLGHCAECHTPRNALGGLKTGADWLTGAPNPAGRGTFPDLVELEWSEAELVEYFTSGFTPEFDSAGGHMALVVENLAALPVEDREAVAAYIAALPVQ